MMIQCFITVQTIVPQYFYQIGDKCASRNPLEYIKKNWGNCVTNLSDEELEFEKNTMILLRQKCTSMAHEDLSKFTSDMAMILNVKQNVLNCEAPVLDRKDWIQSLTDDCSNIQIQKWIFAWMFVRPNYKKLVTRFKNPDEKFEEVFMINQGLQYNQDDIAKMKKNRKTCVQLLYNLRFRSYQDKMVNQIKEKLKINITLKAPNQLRSEDKNYRREPNTFYIGKIDKETTVWTKVSSFQ